MEEHQEAIQGDLGFPSFYRRFLRPLFFEGFAKPTADRSPETNALLGNVRYLNGGLFLEHPIEEVHPDLDVKDEAIAGILHVFDQFTWHLDDTPGGQSDEINPDVLGYILEKYVNQKAFGAYYTPPDLTGYLCDATIDRFLTEKLSDDPAASAALGLSNRQFGTLPDLLTNLDDDLAWRLLGVLKEMTVLDPACGSGAFLVAALKKLLTVYKAVLGHATLSKNTDLQAWLAEARNHPSPDYFLKKEVITRNLYGVDLMPEATEIAKLRLFLALVASAEKATDLEPLPNIDFNLLPGNSLIGLLDVGGDRIIGDMFAAEAFRQSLADKTRLVGLYKGTAQEIDRDDDSGALLQIRHEINDARADAQTTLDEALRLEMKDLGVEVKQATWTGRAEKWSKRAITADDVSQLTPFHWAYEFSEIMARGGFDVIVANPPWDVFQKDEKEFFKNHIPTIQKNKIRIEDWKKRKREFMEDPEMEESWLRYVSSFPHVARYFKAAPEYIHHKGSRKLNLYTLFLERCFRLLHDTGHCGIVMPDGIYNAYGTRGLREMLFDKTKVTALFGFENSGGIFEDVHRQFKFVILTFEKAGTTERFPAAFMRHDPKELERFPDEGAIEIEVDAVRRMASESLGLIEFTSEMDRQVATKMAASPPLSADTDSSWRFALTQEVNITSDSRLFKESAGSGRLPLFTGKMFHQFEETEQHSGYWIEEDKARDRLTKRGMDDIGQTYDYEGYRWVHRRISRSTDTRTLITTIAPPGVITEVNSTTLKVHDEEGTRLISNAAQLYLTAVSNSFTLDWLLRKQVTTTLNMFFLYQLPVPRLSEGHPTFDRLAELAARLVCTTPAFDALAAEMGLGDHTAGATEAGERAAIRAEIDARVALIYGLTEEEFEHVLFHESITGFHRVEDGVREDALQAYRSLAPSPDDVLVANLIAGGEGTLVEFKETFAVNNETGDKHKGVLHSALKTISGFLNTTGGSLLLGVTDANVPVGLDKDYAQCQANNQNADGLENKILTTLADRLTPPPSFGHVDVTFHQIDGQEVCRVLVQPSDQPTRLDGDFYVRDGNRTPKLTDDQAERWLANRQPHVG